MDERSSRSSGGSRLHRAVSRRQGARDSRRGRWECRPTATSTSQGQTYLQSVRVCHLQGGPQQAGLVVETLQAQPCCRAWVAAPVQQALGVRVEVAPPQAAHILRRQFRQLRRQGNSACE